MRLWKEEYNSNMAITMLYENSLPKHLWKDAFNTTCYAQNKVEPHSHFCHKWSQRISKSLIDEDMIATEELCLFIGSSPKDQSMIETKLVFRNKLNKEGRVVRNKARLVAHGYN